MPSCFGFRVAPQNLAFGLVIDLFDTSLDFGRYDSIFRLTVSSTSY